MYYTSREKRNPKLKFMLVDEELALVQRAKLGEKAAVEMLWNAITPKLYGYLVHTLRDTHKAEDIVQDTWLKALKSLPQFHSRGVRFSAWLYAIAKNECRQYWRKSKPEVSIDEQPDIGVWNTQSNDFLFLEKILEKLSSDEQEILRLRYISELSFQEIALVLSLSVISARVRVHRALKKANRLLTSS